MGELYDLVVIGSSFGGVMAAWPSVMAGKRVLMIERGDWVPRGPQNRSPDGFFTLTPAYSSEAPYRVLEGGDSDTLGTIACVGGASVFFGGVSLRLRESRISASQTTFDFDFFAPGSILHSPR